MSPSPPHKFAHTEAEARRDEVTHSTSRCERQRQDWNSRFPFSKSGLLALVLDLPFPVPVSLTGRRRRRCLGTPPSPRAGQGAGACRASGPGASMVCSPGAGGCLSGVPAVPGGLLDLKSMIEKVTGKTALTNYGFYGCYCGWGGRGTPKDGTDW